MRLNLELPACPRLVNFIASRFRFLQSALRQPELLFLN